MSQLIVRATILLAAGSSRRWGAANKLLSRLSGGEPMIVRALRIARAAPAGRLIVVTGAQSARVTAAVRAARVPRVTLVQARAHRQGIAVSLSAGLAALRPAEQTVFIFLGDMPAVPPLLARRLAKALRVEDVAVRPMRAGVPGHPVLLRRPDRAITDRLRGDQGLQPLLRSARLVPAPRGAVLDIDRRTDRVRLR